MAKTLNAQSVADAFADYNNVVILDGIGGKNTETETATTYTVFVPETCAEYLSELRTWVNNNWEGKAMKDLSLADKLAYVVKIASEFEPNAPRSQTPLRAAVQNILCRLNPQAVSGLSGSALVKACAPDVERFLLSASLEKYRSQIEAELVAIQNATSKRSRRDGTGKKEEGVGFVFDMADASTND